MDDAASVALGGKWRIPTKEEWKELFVNCYWDSETIDGVYGLKFESKKSGYEGNWIFLPAAGWRRNDDLDDVGFYGYYWSSSLGTYQVYGIYFEWAVINGFFGFRYSGNSVRPVSE